LSNFVHYELGERYSEACDEELIAELEEELGRDDNDPCYGQDLREEFDVTPLPTGGIAVVRKDW